LTDEHMTPGEYKITLNAQSIASGMYIYDMTVISSESGDMYKDNFVPTNGVQVWFRLPIQQ